MSNKLFLKDIADISVGYSFRSALIWEKAGTTFVIQASNISDNLEISETSLSKIDFDDNRAKSFVGLDDVVLSTRGWFRAAVIKSSAKNILASSSIFILRPTSNHVLSEFLAIYLNSSAGQRQLMSKSTGGAINTILKKDLGEIEIPIPDLESQKLIVSLFSNNQRLRKLMAAKAKLIEELVDGSINNLINAK